MKYPRRRYSFVPALLSAALLVSAYPGAALADGETGVYLDGTQAESYDAALAAAAADSAEHTVTVYSDAETAVRNEFVTGNTVTIRNGDDKATVTQTGQNNISLLIASGQEPTVNLGKEELEATGEEAALVYSDSRSIRLLPCSIWESGAVRGIMTRCGVRINEMRWNENMVEASLEAVRDTDDIYVRHGDDTECIRLKKGEDMPLLYLKNMSLPT